MSVQIQVRRGTTAEWAAAAPVTPAEGEPCLDTDTGILKIGDGVTAYSALSGAVMYNVTTTADMAFVVDDDTMTGDSATKVPTQQSVKAYVDASVTAGSPVVAIAAYDAGWPATPTADIVFWVSEDPTAPYPSGATVDDVVIMPTQVTTAVATTQTGTTYTIDAADDNTTVVCSNSALVTVTIPVDGTTDLRDGYRCRIFSTGAGGVQLGVSGITLLGATPYTKIAQNGYMDIEKTAAANTWIVMGATLAGAAGFAGDTYDYEEGSDNTSITTGNGVTEVTVSAPTYETLAAKHGSLGVQATTAVQKLTYAVPATDFSGSLYLSIETNGASGSNRIISIQTSTDDVYICAVRFHSDGTVAITDSANVSRDNTTTAFWSVGEEFRVDWQANYDAGADTLALTARLFKGANVEGETPDDTLTYTFTSVTADPARVLVGSASTGTWNIYFDTLRMIDTLEWIGPV